MIFSKKFEALKSDLLATDVAYIFENKIAQLQQEHPTLTIGVIGEYSSGKSTMLNALMGVNILPQAADPTTASPTIIEAHDNLQRLSLYQRVNGNDVEISEDQFNDLVLHQKDAVPVIKMPSSTIFPTGFRWIDTPGIDSLDQLHTLATISQLEALDCIVVCLDINKGGITQAIHEFLSMPELLFAKQTMIFVLTKMDTKAPSAINRILTDIHAKIDMYFDEIASNIPKELRVIAISATEQLEGKDGNFTSFIQQLQNTIFRDKEALLSHRLDVEIQSMVKKAIFLLSDLYENGSLNVDELNDKRNQLKEEQVLLVNKRDQAEVDFSAFNKKLPDLFFDVLSPYIPLLASSNEEERLKAFTDFEETLTNVTHEVIHDFVKLDEISLDISSAHIKEMVDNIFMIKDMLSKVVLGLITAYLGGGTGVIANAIEGVFGGKLLDVIQNTKDIPIVKTITSHLKNLGWNWIISLVVEGRLEKAITQLSNEHAIAVSDLVKDRYINGLLLDLTQQVEQLQKQTLQTIEEKSKLIDRFVEVQAKRKAQIELLTNHLNTAPSSINL